MAPPSAIEVVPETDTTGFTRPNPLTVSSVAKRRAATGKLIAGVAAVADVETYKGHTSHLYKPKAKRLDHRLTPESKSRKGNSLKGAAKYLKNPGLISLGGGLPSSEYFPFGEIDFKVPQVGGFSEQETRENGALLRAGKHDLAEDKSIFDIETAFNYGQGHGSAQLLRWISEHTEIVHNPPYQDWSCTMTVGSTSALDMALRMFCVRGDYVLAEQYSFPAALETMSPMGLKVAAVAMDSNGLLATSLDDVLSNWDEAARGGPKPFVLYIVPTGQNPTGSTQTLERRRDVYAVAQKHDVYILEDEPYYFLQMQPYTGADAPTPPPPATHEAFVGSLVPSFLSLDTDGRVMRMDSFSKVIAPGSRVGWVTASEQVIERYRMHADTSTQCPSGVAQLMLFKLLDEHWGHGGYLDWLLHIRLQYTGRRDVMLEACGKYLPKDLVSWVPPQAGMFHWLELNWRKHPAFGSESREDIEEGIFQTIVKQGTLLMKGSFFRAEPGSDDGKMFFRATYAAAKSEQIDEGIRRFGEAIRESFGVKQ